VTTVDGMALEGNVKDRYRQVAEQPHGVFYFEFAKQVAARAGYDADPHRSPARGGC